MKSFSRGGPCAPAVGGSEGKRSAGEIPNGADAPSHQIKGREFRLISLLWLGFFKDLDHSRPDDFCLPSSFFPPRLKTVPPPRWHPPSCPAGGISASCVHKKGGLIPEQRLLPNPRDVALRGLYMALISLTERVGKDQ